MFNPNNIILVYWPEEHRAIDRLANGNKYIIEQELDKWNRVTVPFLKLLSTR